MTRIRIVPFLISIAVAILISGCSPVSVGITLAAKVVGKSVDEADVRELEVRLLGQRPTLADQVLGDRLDVLRDVHGERCWLVYPVKLDPLNTHRYLIEVKGDRVTAIAKVEETGATKADIPRMLLYKTKLKGKSPAECQIELRMGNPLLEVRRDSNHRLAQLYDGRMIKELGGIYYCLLRYDGQDRCEDLDFVSVGAATKNDITQE